ncbi:hypothetical protein [Anaeromassilibacillus senegalensis]|uniref:hypothetical protein n=1 Tax=Anaeromassilibacillus senegalensis TaxID=1673717 RepID=UPI00067F96E8|nr:hypothetical protein [Anaeromassilibacillus senegalensis]
MPDVNLGTVYTKFDIDLTNLYDKVEETENAWKKMGESAQKGSKASEISDAAVQKAAALKQQIVELNQIYISHLDTVTRLHDLEKKPIQSDDQAQSAKTVASYVVEVQQKLDAVKSQLADVVQEAKNLEPYRVDLVPEKNLSRIVRYQEEMESLHSEMEKQRQAIADLQKITEESPPVYSSTTQEQIQKSMEAVEALDAEKAKLKELEKQFNSIQSAQQGFIDKQKDIASGAEMKEAAEEAKEGADLLVTGLRVVNEIAPDLGGNLDAVITQINAIRRAMADGAPSATSYATAITAGIGIAITVIMALVEWYQDMREEQRRAFEEGIEKAREYAQSIAELEANIRILQDNASSVDELRAANDALASTFPDLVIGYDNEGKAIIDNNQRLEERLALMREEERLNREKLLKSADYSANIKAQADKYANLTRQIKEYEEYLAQGQTTVTRKSYAGGSYSETTRDVNNLLADAKKGLQEVEDWMVEFGTNEIGQWAEAAIYNAVRVADANGEMTASLYAASDAQQAYATHLIRSKETTDKMITQGKTYLEIAEEISEKMNNSANVEAFFAEAQQLADLNYILTEQYGQQEAGVGDLSNAYQKLTSGAALSRDELQKLAQTFPTIYEYLDQTHDRTLKNGKILTDVMGQIDYGNQIDSLNDIATAYGKLSDGQQLSVEQLYALAAAYPEVAAYLQETGDYTLRNGEVLKDLFEIRKQVHIQQLEADRDELTSTREKVLDTIDLIQQQIAAYGELARVRGGSLKADSGNALDEGRNEQRYSKAIADQQAATKELADQLERAEQLQKDIDAANARIETIKSQAANIDTFTGSGGKKSSGSKSERNEALAEELKQLDHLSKTERINDEQKLARLEVLQATYRKNADERMDLEYRIFSLQKQMQDKAEQSLADQLSAEYSSIEQDKRMDQLKPDQELERLRDIQRQYMSDARDLKLTQEQQLDLSYRIYQAEKSVAEARKQASQDMLDAVTKEFAHRKAMGEDVTAAELARLEEIQRKVTEVSLKEYDLLTESERVYRLTSEQKMDLDEKVYAARIRLAKEAEQAEKSRYDSELKRIQNKVSLGQYSTEDEIKQLEKLKRKYRKNKEIQMELEIKLYNLKRELHQQEVQAVDNLAEAIMEALRNRYEEQRKAEQDRINESIENWQKWEDETVDAIQGQIDALDELNKQQESEEKRREYERKKQALTLQIAYEKDDYQRKQYQQELARLEEEERKRLDEEAREAERKRLEEEMKKVQEESQKQQDDLRDQLDKVNEEYDKMTSDFQLRAEAEKAIMENTQKEIVELIKAFAPEYNLAGQTIGEKLADGFKNKFRDVLNYVQNVTKQISDYQQTLIDQANAAADKFYQTQQNQAQLPQPPASLASAREAQPVQVTVNFNQPVESPVETRRAIESVMNEIARQIG